MRTGKNFDLPSHRDMSPKTLSSRQSVDSCTLHLQSWKPFSPNSNSKTLDSDSYKPSHAKRPCLSDRATSFPLSVDVLDMSKLSLFDDDNEKPLSSSAYKKDRYRWMARKRRRRGSRSVSGRSSDWSGARTGRCCSIGATCSDFMVAAGATDSSGELFGNGNGCAEANWSSDVSDARNSRRERNVTGERENPGSGLGIDAQVSESGYGSEPGYRGDGEFGYEDEVDEEEEDARFLLWGERFGVVSWHYIYQCLSNHFGLLYKLEVGCMCPKQQSLQSYEHVSFTLPETKISRWRWWGRIHLQSKRRTAEDAARRMI